MNKIQLHRTFLINIVLISLGLMLFTNQEIYSKSKNPFTEFEQKLIFENLSVQHGLSQSNVNAILQDSRGFIWIGTDNGLNKFDGYMFKVFKNIEGDKFSLSNNHITALIEDSLGFIWIGTYGGGLCKYDKTTGRFIRYLYYEDIPNCLGCNYVNSIYEDRSGTIWVGTITGGLNKYNRADDSFESFKIDSNFSNELYTNKVFTVYEDNYGIFWIGTDLGLYQFNKLTKKFTRKLIDEDHPDDVAVNIVKTLFEDSYGTLWTGTGLRGLSRYDREEDKFHSYLIDKSDPNSYTYNDVVEIIEDRNNNLWVGTDGGGLYEFDRWNEEFYPYLNDPNDPTSLSSNYIRSLYSDNSGIIWVGTWGAGINKAVKEKQHFFLYRNDPKNPASLNHNRVLTIFSDDKGTIWLGTDGGGLDAFDVENDSFKHHKFIQNDPASISNNYIPAINQDNNGNLWIGTWGGGLNKLNLKTGRFKRIYADTVNEKGLNSNLIKALEFDSDGNLWIGTFERGINFISAGDLRRSNYSFKRFTSDPENPRSLSNDFVWDIEEDSDGDIWIATKNGLNQFNRDTQLFTVYYSNDEDTASISADYITTLLEPEYAKDFLWVGTWGGGLNKLIKGYKDSPATFEHYTVKDGLPSNNIHGIVEDENENLWISTDAGITKFNPIEESFYNFNVRDGLQGNEFSISASARGTSGEIYFGGVNGFNVFYPTKIKKNREVPGIEITEFILFNEPVLPGEDSPLKIHINEAEEIVLAYDQNAFTFEFASLDMSFPHRNQYAYMLEGFDSEWRYTDAYRRFASYTSLPGGEYLFKIKGSNSDGVWNETGEQIKVIIVPPFWLSWWFISIVFLIVALLSFYMLNRRFKNVRMKIELEAAHTAQMSIMPQYDPDINGIDISGICLPANEVGGDFFDYMWLDTEKTQLGIAVGDVSGKAMNSAMTAVMTSGMMYSKAGENKSVDKIMTELNVPIYNKTDKKMFIALCLAAIDINSKELTFTNAGLMQPLWKRDDTAQYVECNGPKFPLGAIKDTNYGKKTIQLNKNDVILIFTDGISDAQNNSKEFLGVKRIKNMLQYLNTKDLSASEIKSHIVSETNNFRGSMAQHDDITFVVIKIK